MMRELLVKGEKYQHKDFKRVGGFVCVDGDVAILRDANGDHFRAAIDYLEYAPFFQTVNIGLTLIVITRKIEQMLFSVGQFLIAAARYSNKNVLVVLFLINHKMTDLGV